MPSTTATPTDRVQGCQAAYRALLAALSRPGSVCQLLGAAAVLPQDRAVSGAWAATALTLLDPEVTFACLSPAREGIERFIRLHTRSRAVPVAAADFVFAPGDAAPGALGVTPGALRSGTLAYPDRSATLFLAVDGLWEADPNASVGAGGLVRLTLAGPGVPAERAIEVRGLAPAWLVERARLCAQYPLGVDIFLTTPAGSVVGLPRSTRVRWQGEAVA